MQGYDLDGTLCGPTPKRPKPYRSQTGKEREEYDRVREEHYRHAVLIRRPELPFVVITGRSERFREQTEAWLTDHGLVPVALEMMRTARTRKNMIEHKRDVCRHYGVTCYWEDDEKIAHALVRAGVTVVLVNGRKCCTFSEHKVEP